MGQTTFTGPVVSNNGFIDSSFTTAERDAIVNPTAGLLIYNTTVNEYQVYNGSGWQAAFGPPAPVTNTYTVNVDYTNPQGTFVTTQGTGGFKIVIRDTNWSNTAGFATAKAYASGTSVTITVSGSSPYTTTTTANFVEDGMIPGQWSALLTPNPGMPPYPTGNVDTFTIG